MTNGRKKLNERGKPELPRTNISFQFKEQQKIDGKTSF